jgi:phosphate transport system protein
MLDIVMNRFYYIEIENLRSRLLVMGERVTEAFKTSMRSLLNESIAECDVAIDMDNEIDFLENEIEKEAIKYITLRSPVASDLRMVLVSIKAASSLERIGDGATTIARRGKSILAQGKIKVDLLNLEEMATITLDMLETTKNLILQPDTETSDAVKQMDREIDSRNAINLQGYIQQAQEHPDQAPVLFELALISKALERIADHVANVANDMAYLIRGGDLS